MAAANQNPLEAFIWGAGGSKKTPEEIARDKEIAAELLLKAGNTSPVQHWTQGAARVADALSGVIKQKRAERAGEENATYNQSIMSELFKGSTSAQASASPSVSASIPASGASSEMAASAPAPVDLSGDQQTFIAGLLPAAIEESKRTGVDPRIIVAQAAQETGWGKSAPGNNFFGIKSHGQSGGQNLATNEVIDGKTVRINDSFRQFDSPADSVRGYGDFILQNPRYQGLREAKGLDAQLQALGASGYATDPNYSQSVGSIARGIKLPQETASADPQAAFGAVLADPSLITPEDTQRLQAMRGPTGGSTPYSGPGAKIDTPMPVYDTEGLRMPNQGGSLSDEVASFEQTPAYAAQFPGQQPTEQPAMAAQPTPVQQVAQALPSAGQAQQTVPGMSEALLRAISDPRATPQTRAVAQALMQQQAAQQAQAGEQQQWMARQQYEQAQRQNDPATQLDMQYKQAQLDALRGKPSEPAEVQTLRIRAQEAGLQPGTPEYQQFMTSGGKQADSITINNGEGNKFYNKLDEKNAEVFSGLAETGITARSNLAMVDRLGEVLSTSPQGAEAAIKQAAGEFGIPTEGLDNIQAATALINRLVPQQRQPGSGTMSDADLELFKGSLPRLINQPGGNEAIVNDLKAISEYQISMGAIADQVADRALTPEQGREAIRKLPNPLQSFLDRKRTKELDEQDAAAPPKGVDADLWSVMTPEEKALWK